MQNDSQNFRVAPPDKLAKILREMGYPVSAKFLRKMYKAGILPGTSTGKCVLLSLSKAVDMLENGTPSERQSPNGEVRRIGWR